MLKVGFFFGEKGPKNIKMVPQFSHSKTSAPSASLLANIFQGF